MAQAKKAKGKFTMTLDEISQEIDLKSYFGNTPSKKERLLFAEIAIEQIKNRTLDGKTINGSKFKRYSKAYADFKGVTRDSVDLFLEGDMLDSLDYKDNGSKIEIEVKGDLQTKKGYNHFVGDTVPKRPWFGLTDSEAREIADAVKEVVEEKPKKKLTLADLKSALDMLDIEQVE